MTVEDRSDETTWTVAGRASADRTATRTALLGLAVPVYLELLSGVVAGILDVLWVARTGEVAVGAVAVAVTVENVLLGVILMVNIGTTVAVSAATGRGDTATVRAAARAAAVLWLALAPAVALGGYLARDQVAGLFSTPGGEIHHLTVQFFAISFPGIAVFFAQNAVDGVFKGTGDTRTPMRTALLANALILVLDPLLIHGLAGLPRMGVQGAALATVLGRLAALGLSLALLHRRRIGRAPAGEHPTPAPPLRRAIARILTVGLPASGDFVIRMASATALVAVVARFGPVPLAAYGIGTRVLVVATMALYAVRQAAGIHLARTGTPGAARTVGTQALLLATAAALPAGLLLAVAGGPLTRLFTAEPDVVHQGAGLMCFFLPYLLALAGAIGLGGVFTGGGRARSMLWVALLGAAVQIPLAHALGRVPALGVNGVWLAMVLGAAAQSALSWTLFRRHCPPSPPAAGRPAGPARPART